MLLSRAATSYQLVVIKMKFIARLVDLSDECFTMDNIAIATNDYFDIVRVK